MTYTCYIHLLHTPAMCQRDVYGEFWRSKGDLKQHGSTWNPPDAMRLADSSRPSSMNQYREVYKPGVKKAHDVRDPETLS